MELNRAEVESSIADSGSIVIGSWFETCWSLVFLVGVELLCGEICCGDEHGSMISAVIKFG